MCNEIFSCSDPKQGIICFWGWTQLSLNIGSRQVACLIISSSSNYFNVSKNYSDYRPGKLKQKPEQELSCEVGIYHCFCRSVLELRVRVRPTSSVIEVMIYHEIFRLLLAKLCGYRYAELGSAQYWNRVLRIVCVWWKLGGWLPLQDLGHCRIHCCITVCRLLTCSTMILPGQW